MKLSPKFFQKSFYENSFTNILDFRVVSFDVVPKVVISARGSILRNVESLEKLPVDREPLIEVFGRAGQRCTLLPAVAFDPLSANRYQASGSEES